MGHLMFGARIVYGSGIFMTISPSERHNGLAIRLSRYRRSDPLLHPSVAPDESKWIGADQPPLSPLSDLKEECLIELPEYDVRRLRMARDPLCIVDAYTVLVRVVLASLLGVRMCPDCPHCNQGQNPCQNRFGSNAEPQGGILGRCDAIAGSTEAQKSGSLHFHFKAYVQRPHQHKTLLEIARLLRQGLLDTAAFKAYQNWICKETYPDMEKRASEEPEVEKQWPKFANDNQLGQIPTFLWQDRGPHIFSDGAQDNTLRLQGLAWRQKFDAAAQHRMQRVQHHHHFKNPDGSRKPLLACIASSKPGRCKHEFPMDARLTPEALVVCPGIAKDISALYAADIHPQYKN